MWLLQIIVAFPFIIIWALFKTTVGWLYGIILPRRNNLNLGDGSKPIVPLFCSHQNSWDLWMFIPLKMLSIESIGIDPYPYWRLSLPIKKLLAIVPMRWWSFHPRWFPHLRRALERRPRAVSGLSKAQCLPSAGALGMGWNMLKPTVVPWWSWWTWWTSKNVGTSYIIWIYMGCSFP